MKKLYGGNIGYVAERKLPDGSHVVIYDRCAGFEIDADDRWIVMHEPSTRFVSCCSLQTARSIMVAVANGDNVVDIAVED